MRRLESQGLSEKQVDALGFRVVGRDGVDQGLASRCGLSTTAGALLCGGAVAVAVSTESNDGDVMGLLGLIVGASGVIAFSFKAFTDANRAADPE